MSEMENVTGLWTRQTKDGRDYLQVLLRKPLHFELGDKILIFANTRKEHHNHPDFNMLVVRDAASQEAKAKPQSQAQGSFIQPQPQVEAEAAVVEDDDDVPF